MFKDPILQQLHDVVIQKLGPLQPISVVNKEEYFQALAEKIVGQQLAVRAAEVITERVRVVVGSEFTPAAVLTVPFETLRGAGLSNAKTNYVRNIAEAWTSGLISVEKLDTLDDESLIIELTKIKGVGRWTAEMFLIFTLGRTDVFSIGDYGLRKAIIKAYGLDPLTQPAVLLELSQSWQPHRSLASRVLWKSLELPVEETSS
jgi:DNA-3-methyladenine glycosylase II